MNFFKSFKTLAIILVIAALFAFGLGFKRESFVVVDQTQPFKHFQIKDDGVYYYGTKLEGADPKSFKELPNRWGKDTRNVYWEQYLEEYLDTATVQILGSLYVKDKNAVWLYATGYHQKVEKMDADPATFELLDGSFGKDKRGIYYSSKKIMGVDPATFTVLKNKNGTPFIYAKDSKRAYYASTHLVAADVASLEYLDESYAKDSKYVYHQGNVIPGADPHTFEFVMQYFAKDKNKVYAMDKPLEVVLEPKSFELVRYAAVIKDANNVYFRRYAPHVESYQYLPVEGVDAPTFTHLGSCATVEMSSSHYYRDKNNIYIEDMIFEDADPETFEYLGWVVYGEEIPASKSYAKDKNHVYHPCGKILEGVNPNTFVPPANIRKD